MSCFIMNPTSLAYIANFITDQMNQGFNFTGISIHTPEKLFEEVSINGIVKAKMVYKLLFRTNIDAYLTRYSKTTMDDMQAEFEAMNDFDSYDQTIHRSRYTANHKWEFQMLKSLECWIYQCSESEEIESTEIYLYILKLINAMRQRIIARIPEYENADWD